MRDGRGILLLPTSRRQPCLSNHGNGNLHDDRITETLSLLPPLFVSPSSTFIAFAPNMFSALVLNRVSRSPQSAQPRKQHFGDATQQTDDDAERKPREEPQHAQEHASERPGQIREHEELDGGYYEDRGIGLVHGSGIEMGDRLVED